MRQNVNRRDFVKNAGADKSEIGVQNFWACDDAPETPQVREEIRFIVHPAEGDGRAIDFHLKMTNATDEVLTFLGATGKGYGGFNFRPDARRRPFTFTTAKGLCNKDALMFDTPWADIVSKTGPDGPVSGAAIFQHSGNPGYPHHGWIFRHYGFLGACWPHVEPHALEPGESFDLRYRLYIHRGTAEEAGVAERFNEYVAEAK